MSTQVNSPDTVSTMAQAVMPPPLKDKGWKIGHANGRFRAKNEKLGKYSVFYSSLNLALEAAAALDNGMKMIVLPDGTTEFEEDTDPPVTSSTTPEIDVEDLEAAAIRDEAASQAPAPANAPPAKAVPDNEPRGHLCCDGGRYKPIARADCEKCNLALEKAKGVAPTADVASEADAVIEDAKQSPAAARTTALASQSSFGNQLLPLTSLRKDGGTQPRASLDMLKIEEYREAKRDGANFPAVKVFYDGTDCWLWDGFHRERAAALEGEMFILTDVQPGTQRDAILASLGANATHGLPRTNEDKRNAVLKMLADAEWSQWADRRIAKATGTTHPFVGDLRKKQEELTGNVTSQVRAGSDGRVIDTSLIGAAAEADERQASLADIPGALPEPAEDEERASADSVSQVSWEPEEIVAALKRHGDALTRDQLEEMGCSYASMLNAAGEGAIARDASGKFTLPDHKQQPVGAPAPPSTKAEVPATDTDPEGWSEQSVIINLAIKAGKSPKRGISISGRHGEGKPLFLAEFTVADLEPMPRAMHVLIEGLKKAFVKQRTATTTTARTDIAKPPQKTVAAKKPAAKAKPAARKAPPKKKPAKKGGKGK